jgi:hypothetical protein
LASSTAPATLPWSWYSDPELLRREQELRLMPESEKLIAHFQGLVREALG